MFFYHDELAQDESKLIKLRRRLGYEGYGIYWAIIERIHRTDSLSIEFDVESISYSLQANQEVVAQVLCDFGLFEIDEGTDRIASTYLNSMTNKKPRKRRTTKTINPNKAQAKAQTGTQENDKKRTDELDSQRFEEQRGRLESTTIQAQKPTQREVVYVEDDGYDSFERVEAIDENVIEPVVEAWNDAYQGTKNTKNLESVKSNYGVVRQILELQRSKNPTKKEYKTVFDYNRKCGRYANRFETIFQESTFTNLLTKAQEEEKKQDGKSELPEWGRELLAAVEKAGL